ncbi:MAG: alanine--tRNA ligase [Deltaproteobacteria bacterium]|nr:alanine--tRNA ligase [Deltaproteobacteria bacterium]
MRASEIREIFLKFFEKAGHTRVASSSLIPFGDLTLYFTNAGMVQFKDVFLGAEKRATTRATTSQKCMRVSGKHNDLENVGHTPRHHTFFEMLGNFSFGDYFKEEAIAFAWEFLTKTLKLPKEKLIITVYEKDDDAGKLWLKHVSKDQIFRLGEKDNFWSMGDTGPCGPCSEILWDFGSGKITKKDLESDRFMEIWNLVFMQFNRGADGVMTPLPKPSVDTGMGLERLACVLQGKKNNWETDLFTPIIESIERVTKQKHDASQENAVAMRVIADHVRAASFLIADGLLPSNEGRDYVLRRILRRAIRYGRKLGMHKPFFAAVAETVMKEMGSAYPELLQHKEIVVKVLTNEEERFLETLDRGLNILEEEFKQLQKAKQSIVPGEIVFKLYDTYGFPKDLTELIAREKKIDLDEKGFEEAMQKQRERARKAWKGSGSFKVEPVYQTLRLGGLKTEFVGYEKESDIGEILGLLKEGKKIEYAKKGERIQLIVNRTPFYAEGGGQVGDTGIGLTEDIELEILDTQKPFPDLFVHDVKVVEGEISVKDRVNLEIDRERRQKIRCNHTATHLLHAALRQILGGHVKQAGSYLDDQYLRFDFSHFEAITDKQLADIEDLVNKVISKNIPVKVEVLPYKEAIAKGALAFFGEKYGDVVRLIQIPDFSIELCGGTHTASTGEIGLIKIVKERSVANGVRRIEAVSGFAAQEFVRGREFLLKEENQRGIETEKQRQKEKEEKSKRMQAALKNADDLLKKIKEIHGVKVLAVQVLVADAGELREVADAYKQKMGSGIVALGADTGGKVALIIMITPDLTKKYSAGNLMKQLAPLVGGTGGGRPDMAQGGGPEIANLPKVFKRLEELL